MLPGTPILEGETFTDWVFRAQLRYEIVCHILTLMLASAFCWTATTTGVHARIYAGAKLMQILVRVQRCGEKRENTTNSIPSMPAFTSVGVALLLLILSPQTPVLGSFLHRDVVFNFTGSASISNTTSTGLYHVMGETESAAMYHNSWILYATCRAPTGLTMGLKNTHYTLFWLHAALVNTVASVILATAMMLTNPKPWSIAQWGSFGAWELVSCSGFICGTCVSAWMVQSYWYPQFNAMTAFVKTDATSKSQLGTGTGVGMYQDALEEGTPEHVLGWEIPHELLAESKELSEVSEPLACDHSPPVSQSSFMSSSVSFSTYASESSCDAESAQPRKLPRFETSMSATANPEDMITGQRSQPSTPPACESWGGSDGDLTAVVDLQHNVVMSNAGFDQLCSQIGCGDQHAGLVHLQKIISKVNVQLLWAKASVQQLCSEFDEASEFIHVRGMALYISTPPYIYNAYMGTEDKILFTIQSYTLSKGVLLGPFSRARPGEILEEWIDIQEAALVLTGPHCPGVQCTGFKSSNRIPTKVGSDLPANMASLPGGLEVKDVLGISECWIDSQAAHSTSAYTWE